MKAPLHQLEKQYLDLMDKAKKVYPDIDDSISMLSNMVAKTDDINDFLNLSEHTPAEISNNQVIFR